jgi:hypothetical protein
MNSWLPASEITKSGERGVKLFNGYRCVVAKITLFHEPNSSLRLYLAAPLP